ncbi:hypothetical protein ACA910_015865 [Epithemia clementina (nom. ined.)]
MEADLEVKEHQLSRLPKLQQQLKEMIKGREELQAALGGVEADLERRSKQLTRESQRYGSLISDLQSEVDDKNREIVNLRQHLEEAEEKLEKQKGKLSEAQTDLQSTLVERNNEIESLKSKLSKVESDLAKRKKDMSSLSSGNDGEFSFELQMKVEQLTKTKASLEAQLREHDEEGEEREQEYRESSERYSNQIRELRIKVEELTQARNTLKQKLSSAETELEKKTKFMSATSSQYTGEVSDLHSRIGDLLSEKDTLQARNDELEAKLDAMRKDLGNNESRAIEELKSRLEAESKEKRALKSQVGDAESELERKDKQIRDVVDRYTKEISELETKLSDQLAAKMALQKEVDSIKNDLFNVSDVSSEANCLRDRVASLEKSIELERTIARDAEKTKKRVEETLEKAKQEQADLSERLQKATSERAEVIAALEEVIHEVQNREEEIESYAKLLAQRDDELEHAKLIAQKAIASAQAIQNRAKEKGTKRQSELEDKISNLQSTVDFLADKNDHLEKRAAMLERELNGQKGSDPQGSVPLRRSPEKEDKSHKSELTKSTRSGRSKSTRSSRPKSAKKNDRLNDFVSRTSEKVDEHGFAILKDETEQFPSPKFGDSPSNASSSTASSHTNENIPELAAESMSTNSADLAHADGWMADFGEDASTLDSGSELGGRVPKTEPSGSKSRRSIERDALRKYVRKRYLKSRSNG